MQEAATNGGNVYLVNDIAVTSEIAIATGKTLTLCLNGKRLYKGGSGSFDIISVGSDGKLNLADCKETGEISGALNAGIYLGRKATLNMFGGNIKENNGGGIKTYLYTTVKIYGGKITNNRTNGHGGGIHMSSGTLYLYDGEISGNNANYGGGVDGSISFFLYGGKIINNTANMGGGIYTSGGVRVAGAPVVSGNKNTNGDADNIFVINGNHCIQIDAPPHPRGSPRRQKI